MEKIELRPISPEEYEKWQAASRAHYAIEKEKSGLTKEEAIEEAESSFRRLLPEGARTPDHFIYSVIEKSSNRVVGTFWWTLRKNNRAWVYDIMLGEESRGKGYGRATMLLGQADMKAKGVTTLELHVFGHNDIAQNLYRSLGFQATNIVMSKKL
ncbi:MAG: GNAT family N-acetyltransferase [Bdellovibrionota bacterium]